MDSPEQRVEIGIAETERLKEYLGSLSNEAWNNPSACNRWDVRDVIAHLAWIAESYTERIYQSLQEGSSLPEGQPAKPPFSEDNAQRAISRRERLGDQVLSDFIRTTDQLNQLLTTLRAPDWDKPHYYASLGIAPMRFRPDLWISELSMHGWDIRSRLEPEAHLSEESLPVFTDMVRDQLTKWILHPGPRLAEPVRYRWELTGAGATNMDILAEGDKASVGLDGTAEANVTFRCDTEAFILVVFGRLTIDAAGAADRLTIQGDKTLAHEFQLWFPGA